VCYFTAVIPKGFRLSDARAAAERHGGKLEPGE
jgi:hypothetical protein